MKSETAKLLEVRKHFKVCPACGGSGERSVKPFELSICNSCPQDSCDGERCSILRGYKCLRCDGTGIVINL